MGAARGDHSLQILGCEEYREQDPEVKASLFSPCCFKCQWKGGVRKGRGRECIGPGQCGTKSFPSSPWQPRNAIGEISGRCSGRSVKQRN